MHHTLYVDNSENKGEYLKIEITQRSLRWEITFLGHCANTTLNLQNVKQIHSFLSEWIKLQESYRKQIDV